jgi:prolyl-tRNA synthetase
MGGSVSEEFMVASRVGEEEIVQCTDCDYVANREKAAGDLDRLAYTDSGELALVHTPDVKTIAALEEFMSMGPEFFVKTLLYRFLPQQEEDSSAGSVAGGESPWKFVLALIRGDLELNETKLKNALRATVFEKASADEALSRLGIPLGFVGPIGVEDGVTILADHSVRPLKGGVTGANREDYHYMNVNAERDFEPETYTDLRLVTEGDRCPNCGNPLRIFRGIELGHIFKLGDKYTKAFSATYLDENSVEQVPIMGCYGIGVERTIAAVIEQNHDENGIVWPISIAPFHVHLLPVKYGGQTKDVCDRLYRELKDVGIEVLLDDRELRPGVKFKDADLIGVPYRVTVGDRGLEKGTVELVNRKTGDRESLGMYDVLPELEKRIRTEQASFT